MVPCNDPVAFNDLPRLGARSLGDALPYIRVTANVDHIRITAIRITAIVIRIVQQGPCGALSSRPMLAHVAKRRLNDVRRPVHDCLKSKRFARLAMRSWSICRGCPALVLCGVGNHADDVVIAAGLSPNPRGCS